MNPLDQTIPNVVELHKNYISCYEAYIIMQDKNKRQDKQLADIQIEKNDLIQALDNTRNELGTSKGKLNSYKMYLEFIGSIANVIHNMDMCKSYLEVYCYCSMNKNAKCAERYYKYLNCKDAIPENHYTTIKGPYIELLDQVLTLKTNLTQLLINGNFELLEEVYEANKDFPMDNCQFICDLDVENVNSKFAESKWKFFEDGWKFFSRYF